MRTATFSAFSDELRKIAAIDLGGLSPQAALNAPRPEPMQTSGYDKAVQILSRMGSTKTAARKKPLPIMDGFDLPKIDRSPDRNTWEKSKGLLTHGLAGAGGGRLVAEMSIPRGASPRAKWVGTVSGLGVGLGDYAYQKLKRTPPKPEAFKKAAGMTPAMSLKASKQVGQVSRARNMGAGPKIGVPRIGLKGTLPF